MIINQHLRNGGQILSVAMPVIQPAFITDKGPNSTLCRPGFAFNKRRLCFNGVWRLSVVQMAAPNCSLLTQTQKKNRKNAGRFFSKQRIIPIHVGFAKQYCSEISQKVTIISYYVEMPYKKSTWGFFLLFTANIV